METRIKIHENQGGDKSYCPQAKRSWFHEWSNIYCEGIWDNEKLLDEHPKFHLGRTAQWFKSINVCKKSIDKYLEFVANQKLLSTKRVHYIKYP